MSDYDVEDLSNGYARFADGRGITVESTWLSPSQVEGIGVDLWGTEGFASITPLRLISWKNGEYVDRTETIRCGPCERWSTFETVYTEPQSRL